jgi:hypothetical protein
MSIPPISSSWGAIPNPSNALVNELANRLASFRKLSEAWQNDPTTANLQALESCMTGLENFLDSNKTALFQDAAGQGWGPNGPLGSNFATFYSSTLSSIQNFFENPNDGSLEMVNEGTTQMHFLLANLSGH